MAAIKLRSWKDINDEILFSLIRNSKGLIESELTRPPLIKTIEVNDFSEYSKEEAIKFAIEYFKKWVFVLKDEVLFEKNIELAKDLKKVYDSDFGYYFAVIKDIEYTNIFLLELELRNIEKTIKKVRENFGAGPTELELMFTPNENIKDMQKRLNKTMKEQMFIIKTKHKDFLITQRDSLYTYLENTVHNVISKYK